MCWEARQRIDSQLSKLRFEALFMILFHGWYLNKWQETLFFNLMYDKFWFDADFCASRFHK